MKLLFILFTLILSGLNAQADSICASRNNNASTHEMDECKSLMSSFLATARRQIDADPQRYARNDGGYPRTPEERFAFYRSRHMLTENEANLVSRCTTRATYELADSRFVDILISRPNCLLYDFKLIHGAAFTYKVFCSR